MSVKTRQRALMYAIGKKVKGLVDVKEHTTDNCWCRHERHNEWIGYPTYMIRYEDCWCRGEYITAEFLPSKQTQEEIDRAIAELTFQAEGLEFPEPTTENTMGHNTGLQFMSRKEVEDIRKVKQT